MYKYQKNEYCLHSIILNPKEIKGNATKIITNLQLVKEITKVIRKRELSLPELNQQSKLEQLGAHSRFRILQL